MTINKNDLLDKLSDVKYICREASKKILEIYNTDFDVEYKEDNSPLTLADKISNQLIVDYLKNKYPEISFLSEEFEDDRSRLNNEWCWIIDPLDGTKEFLKKNDEFTINVALVYKKEAVLGLVFVPVTDEIYFAVKGEGAYFEKNGIIKKIKVSDKKDNLTLVKSRSHASDDLKNLIEKNSNKINKIIDSGSSIKGCLIARGLADIYYRFGPTMEWDTAAMQCIIEEAGGVFLQINGDKMYYNRKDPKNIGFFVLNNIANRLSF